MASVGSLQGAVTGSTLHAGNAPVITSIEASNAAFLNVYFDQVSGAFGYVGETGRGVAFSGAGPPLCAPAVPGTPAMLALATSNAAGIGAWGAATLAVIPPTPSVSAAVSGEGSVAIAVSAVGACHVSSNADMSGAVAFGVGNFACQVVGLSPGVAYAFSARGSNAFGVGAWSPPATVIAAALPPAPFVAAIATAPRIISVAGSNGDGQGCGYAPILKYLISSNAFGTVVGRVGASAAVTYPSLTVGKTYTYAAAAVNAAGIGPWSALTSCVACTTPIAPTLFAAVVGAQSIAATVVSVPNSNPFVGYAPILMYLLTSNAFAASNAPWSTTATSDSSNTFLLNGWPVGTSRNLYAAASNAVGIGAWSPVVTAVSASAPTYAVSAPVAAPTSNGAITVTFTPLSNATPYNGYSPILGYVLGSNAVGYSNVYGVTTGAPSIVATWLTPGAYYSFCVAASNAAGVGAWSQASSNVMACAPPSVAPTMVAVPAPRIQTNTVAFSLSALDAIDGYSPITGYVISSAADASSIVWASNLPSGTASVVLTGLTTGTSNFYAAASNVAGIGAFSAAVQATSYGVPLAPVSISAIATSDSNIVLTVGLSNTPLYTGCSDIQAIVVASSPGITSVISNYSSVDSNSSSYINAMVNISKFSTHGAYVYYAAAVNSYGIGAWSSNVTILT